jgi:TldD protein
MEFDRAVLDEMAQIALKSARLAGADYADIRIVEGRQQSLFARNERIAGINDSGDKGFGVRCLANGAWGFASSSVLTPESVQNVAKQAAEIARASSIAKVRNVDLAPEPIHKSTYVTPRVTDPFEIPLESKASLLLECTDIMRKVEEVKVAIAMMYQLRSYQLYASTEGSNIFLDRLIVTAWLKADTVGNNEKQSRSYQASPQHAGWEQIIAADLVGNAPRVAQEAREKLFAEPSPTGNFDLILDPEHLHLTMHESIGHATELDRVLGYEADYAGTSFAKVEDLGKLQYGSKIVNAVADNTTPEFLASTGFDDDGVEGQKWDIIREGVLVDFTTSRETAPQIGSNRSHGSCRADGWENSPILRIPNLGILPNKGTPEELIADTKDGILIHGSGTWSIDQRRLNFQFGGDLFYRIKNGKRAGMLKDVIYRSSTPVFWNACDAICGPEDWRAFGVLNCGKGQPGQTGFMSHYSATSRFRKIEVGRGEE